MIKFLLTYVLLSGSPLNQALESCESPATLRAAFTVELVSGQTSQICQYDPRPESYKAFTCSLPHTPSALLEQTIAQWESNPDPDNWLFANGIKQYFVHEHQIDDLGAAWRVRFAPNTLDSSGTTRIARGEAWLLPEEQRFLRVSYEISPESAPQTNITRHLMFDQVDGTHFSYVHSFEEEIAAETTLGLGEVRWSARVLDVNFFYAEPNTGEIS